MISPASMFDEDDLRKCICRKKFGYIQQSGSNDDAHDRDFSMQQDKGRWRKLRICRRVQPRP